MPGTVHLDLMKSGILAGRQRGKGREGGTTDCTALTSRWSLIAHPLPPSLPPSRPWHSEDPLYRDNELKYQWVCQDAWTYSTKVDLKVRYVPSLPPSLPPMLTTLPPSLPPSPLPQSMKVAGRDKDAPWMLQFDGIDTVASVTWNGKALPGREGGREGGRVVMTILVACNVNNSPSLPSSLPPSLPPSIHPSLQAPLLVPRSCSTRTRYPMTF